MAPEQPFKGTKQTQDYDDPSPEVAPPISVTTSKPEIFFIDLILILFCSFPSSPS
jgi:hypothetical protein